MKHAKLILLLMAVAVIASCEPQMPEEKRFPNAQVKFEYRGVERTEQEIRNKVGQYKVEFINKSTPQELKAYIWWIEGDPTYDAAPTRNVEEFQHYFIVDGARKVSLTCVDQYRLNFDNSLYDDTLFFYTDSFTINITGHTDSVWRTPEPIR